MTLPELPRPTPLRDVAHDVTLTVGLAGAVITALVGYGVITVTQGDALTGLLGLIPGVTAGISTAIATFRTAKIGEVQVTPLSSPRNAAGQTLAPQGVAGKHEA